MTNPVYNVELVDAEDGNPAMVKITVGVEQLMLSVDEAFDLASAIENTAILPSFNDHIDQLLDGDDGAGTC